MKAFEKVCDVLSRILSYISFAGFVVIMMFIVLNVVLRAFFDSPILGAYEIVEQMMMVGVFTSFAYAQRQGSHIRITMLLMHLPRQLSMLICTLTGLASTGIVCLLTYAAYRQFVVAQTNHYTSAMLDFPISPFYVLEIVTCAVFALTLLLDTLKDARGIFDEELAKELTKDWT